VALLQKQHIRITDHRTADGQDRRRRRTGRAKWRPALSLFPYDRSLCHRKAANESVLQQPNGGGSPETTFSAHGYAVSA